MDFSGIWYMFACLTRIWLLILLQKSNESLRNVSHDVNISHTHTNSSKLSFYDFLLACSLSLSPSFSSAEANYCVRWQLHFQSLFRPGKYSIYALHFVHNFTHFIAVILITNKFRFNFLALLPRECWSVLNWFSSLSLSFYFAAMWLMLIRGK